MEQIIDSLKRIITRWVRASSSLVADVQPGDTTIKVLTTRRFKRDEEIMLKDGSGYEKPNNFRVVEILDRQTLQVNQPIQHGWSVADNSVVLKTIQGQLVQGIYPYDPENITLFPAVTIFGVSDEREWLTLDSVKHHYSVTIGIYHENSGMENGYRGLLQLTKLVSNGLSNNLFPLVNDYETTAMTADVVRGDATIKVADASIFCVGNIVLLEDHWKSMENRVAAVDKVNNTITLQGGSTHNYHVIDGPIVILVRRFIYNSYPKSVKYDVTHKGTLLKAAAIEWFGEEEEIDPTDGGGWSDPSLE